MSMKSPGNRRRHAQVSEELAPEWERGNATRTFAPHPHSKKGLALIDKEGRVSRVAIPSRLPNKRPFSESLSSIEQPASSRSGSIPEPESLQNDAAAKNSKRRKGSRVKAKLVEKSHEDANANFEHERTKIASLASAVVADPENNIGKLSDIRTMAKASDKRIAALAVLTESQLYKDICPAYRIRPISEEEMKVKVSKDVANLRNFEQSLLAAYRRFLNSVISLSRWSCGGSSKSSQLERRMQRLRRASCTALIEAARALLHFNYSSDFIPVVAAFTVDRDMEVRQEASQALSEVLEESHRCAGASLSARVQLAECLSKTVKKRSAVAPPEALAPLLAIEFSKFPEFSSFGKPTSPVKKKFNRKHRKKLRPGEADRIAKEEAERARQEKLDLERDMKEAHAEASPQELFAAKKSLLSSVCLACFNVIRHASETALLSEHAVSSTDIHNSDPRVLQMSASRKPPPALSEALQGVLGVTSIIDEGIVDAILAAVVPLLEGETLPLTTRFRCLRTGYSILSAHAAAQGAEADSFTRDARSFDTCLYRSIARLHRLSPSVAVDTTIEAVQAIAAAFRGRKVPSIRAAAIARRLGILAVSQAPNHGCCIGLLSSLQLVMPPQLVSGLYPSMDSTESGGAESLDSRRGNSEMYDALLDDPDLAGAEHSEAWELSALQAYFHPSVRQMATAISRGLCGDQMPSGAMDPVSVATMYSRAEGGFYPAPEKTFKGPRRKNKNVQPCSAMEALLRGSEMAVDDFPVAYWERTWRLWDAS